MYENTTPPEGVNDTESLAAWGSSRGIGVYERALSGAPALCVTAPVPAVAIDTARLGTEAARRCALAHELGHLETGCLYGAASGRDAVGRAEYRADLWAVQVLIPRRSLIRAVADGCTEAWQIAERLQVTERLVRFAAAVYDISPEEINAARRDQS